MRARGGVEYAASMADPKRPDAGPKLPEVPKLQVRNLVLAGVAVLALWAMVVASQSRVAIGVMVVSTAVGYAAGSTPNPTYREVCSGRTGHNEVVRVIFDPTKTSYEALLKVFWENHDPTQGMRQGADEGTQYRSGIYVYDDAQRAAAESSRAAYGAALRLAGRNAITTEVLPAPTFYFAEEYHQQYLDKNPDGYCGIGGTGVACPIGTGVRA